MVNILGVHFNKIDFETAIKTIERYVHERLPRQIIAPDANVVIKARKDPGLKQIINSSDLVLADGMSIMLASRFLGTPLPERITGIDLALKLCERSQTKGYSIYFLGAEEKVSEKAIERLKENYPKLRVAGRYSPPFGDLSEEEETRIGDKIKSSSADILFVSFYAGRQEKWIRENMKRLGATVYLGVGSFLDIMAGRVKRAPRWAQRIGLEWLFRFAQDPIRLFGRYAIDVIKFFFLVLCQKAKKLCGVKN